MDILNVEIYDVDSVETEIVETEKISGQIGNFFGYMVPPNAANYIHKQGIPSNIWLINHNLNKYCSIVVVDSANQVIYPEINYIDKNTIQVVSTGAFTGQAYCN